MLEVLDIHTYYGDSHVLHGVTLTAAQGTVTAVLGRNGVGKTTLCRSLVGLTPARSGSITFNGTNITGLPPYAISRLGIALVPQGRRMFSSLTVQENLAIAARPAAASAGRRRKGWRSLDERQRSRAEGGVGIHGAEAEGGVHRAETEGGVHRAEAEGEGGWSLHAIFEVFPRLAERLQNRGDELSGGEQQMLAIARALVANPLLVVMDEPTEGLAPALVGQVASLIRRLKQRGTTVLLVEQNAAFAVTLADQVHVMSKGTIVHSSTAAALWENEEIKTQLLGVPSSAASPRVAR